MRRITPKLVLLLALASTPLGCSGATSLSSDAIVGFDLPESALYSSDGRWIYVSNMVGNPTARDGNGRISRVRVDEGTPPCEWSVEHQWIAGANDPDTGLAIELHGPKGLREADGLLWVADIDCLRAFELETGMPAGVLDLRAHDARSLNDLAVHPGGGFLVTDTRLVFAADGSSRHDGVDRLYHVQTNGAVTIAFESDALMQPNGIEWNPADEAFWIAPLAGRELLAWRPGEPELRIVGDGPGRFDGLELSPAGAVLVSSLADSSVGALVESHYEPRWEGLELPGNLALDPEGRWLAIPCIGEGVLRLRRTGGPAGADPARQQPLSARR